ncbi:MAG: RnfH family protein [Gammaproteobacteria bacterium]|nr:RnfH family protein [Gammaproteobacteria bacterium]
MVRITLVLSQGLRQVLEFNIELPTHSIVKDALQVLSSWHIDLPEELTKTHLLYCWGKQCTPEQKLQDGDRIELLRHLLRSPRESRARRFATQGMRKAGLFKK